MSYLDTAAFFALLSAPIPVLVILLWSLWRRRWQWDRTSVLWATAFLLALLVHPIVQYLLLEPLDTWRGATLARCAHAAGIVGMDEEQVHALLGEPSRIRRYEADNPTWEYEQLPGYWSGSHFQVFFRSGIVAGIEPNDD